MRITILDGRHLVGRFMAFDRHMNIVLGDAEEFRRLPPKKGVPEADREIRRPLGLVLVRGEEVISMTVEGPPPTDDRRGKRDVAPVRPRALARLLSRRPAHRRFAPRRAWGEPRERSRTSPAGARAAPGLCRGCGSLGLGHAHSLLL
jgi:small nuclear ribonucleoprotein (snRNP)-like protein